MNLNVRSTVAVSVFSSITCSGSKRSTFDKKVSDGCNEKRDKLAKKALWFRLFCSEKLLAYFIEEVTII